MFLFCKEATSTFLKKFSICEKLESGLALFCRNGRWQRGYWERGIYSHITDRKEMACCWRGISLEQKLAAKIRVILSKKLHLIRSVQKLDDYLKAKTNKPSILQMQVVQMNGLKYVVWELMGFKYRRKKQFSILAFAVTNLNHTWIWNQKFS